MTPFVGCNNNWLRAFITCCIHKVDESSALVTITNRAQGCSAQLGSSSVVAWLVPAQVMIVWQLAAVLAYGYVRHHTPWGTRLFRPKLLCIEIARDRVTLPKPPTTRVL